MSTSSTSISDLADLSLARIFSFLPPDERVRLERVSRRWGRVARKLGWTTFKKLTLDGQELARRSDWAVAKYQALIDRCAPHLRELNCKALDAGAMFAGQQLPWPKLRNLRHLHFDVCVSSATLRAVANNLSRLQSIHFSGIDWQSVAGLHDLLRVNNASLQALGLPLCNSVGASLRLPALPSCIRSLHISEGLTRNRNRPSDETKRSRVDELLELAASCCPQLAMLMLPIDLAVSGLSLAKLARFERLFYLRLCFDPLDANLFHNLLAKIGARLTALLLGKTEFRILDTIAHYCYLLEHLSFDIGECHEEGLSFALQSLSQLAHLRSLSVCHYHGNDQTVARILATIKDLNAKGNIEYLHLSRGLPLPVEFIRKLFQHNPKLRKLTCTIRREKLRKLTCTIRRDNNALQKICKMAYSFLRSYTPSGRLRKLLQNTESPLLELELFEHCPPELEMGQNSRVRVRKEYSAESISQQMLRHFWARAMDSSVADLDELDK